MIFSGEPSIPYKQKAGRKGHRAAEGKEL